MLQVRGRMTKTYFATIDLAYISIFSALWIILNYTIAPLSFTLTRLPVIHNFVAFFIVLLVTWVTGKFGAAAFVGVVGSIIVLLIGGPLPVVGFAAATVLFDLLMGLSRHRISTKVRSIIVTVVATITAAYFAGVVNGILILNLPLQFAATVFGGWNLVGGMVSVAVTLPIISTLERTNVKKQNRINQPSSL